MLHASKLSRLSIRIDPKVPFLINGAEKFKLPPLNEEVEVSQEQLLTFLEDALRMRWMEQQCFSLYLQRHIRGFCHLYIGQEAIAVGMSHVIRPEDAVVTSYRDHCWYLARGGTVREMIAECMGKRMGCSKGKGGSMHMYNRNKNFFGGNGIVGAQVPIGTGLGLAKKLGHEKPWNVSVTLYGDGAANQGQVHEAMNIAAIHKLPVLFVVENNQFAMGTSLARSSANPSFYNRASYIPGLRVDAMNTLAVVEATRWAREWASEGNGPVVLEMDSYRYKGHSMSDPDSGYRTKDDVRKVRDERDMILHLRSIIEREGIASQDKLNALDKRIKREVLQEVKVAIQAPPPDASELITDVYSEAKPIRSCQGTMLI